MRLHGFRDSLLLKSIFSRTQEISHHWESRRETQRRSGQQFKLSGASKTWIGCTRPRKPSPRIGTGRIEAAGHIRRSRPTSMTLQPKPRQSTARAPSAQKTTGNGRRTVRTIDPVMEHLYEINFGKHPNSRAEHPALSRATKPGRNNETTNQIKCSNRAEPNPATSP
jgi:hypothetical protein